MSSSALEMVTSSTTEEEGAVAEVVSFMQKHEVRRGAAPETTYYLSGVQEGDRVELTKALYDILKQAAEALALHRSVSIFALDQEITTQQAAEILGLSRPTVVKLINDQRLPATVPGAVRRKLRLRDVLKFRDQLHEERSNFIAESSADFDDDVDPAEARELLAEVRKTQ